MTSALQRHARAILLRELGLEDCARFFRENGHGTGNYTRDRSLLLAGETIHTLHDQAAQLAASGQLPRPARAELHLAAD